MQALTVEPLVAGSVQVMEVPDPVPGDGEMLVAGLAVGLCGTDREIAAGDYGWPPPGQRRLVLGHESLGRVLSAPAGGDFAEGDLVVGVVRRPDPVPCGACAHDEFDMCRNGQYTERGIKEIDGFASELWCIETDYAVKLDPRLARSGMLMEPTSVVAKAWEQIERVGGRAWFEPRRVLVTGAGPIGLLAALLGVQRGLEVHVLDLASSGPKPAAVAALGAAYHHDGFQDAIAGGRPDIIIEATGVPDLITQALAGTAAYGVLCLTGVSPVGRSVAVDVGAANREVVLENDVVVGSVNANLRHYAAAADALTAADPEWLERLITRRVPLSEAADALDGKGDEIKVVVTLTDGYSGVAGGTGTAAGGR
jgi:glucose 1-dehydrogenase